MYAYLASRLVQGIVSLLAASLIIFVLVRLTGSPLDVYLPLDATAEDRALMARVLGVDQPVPVQYAFFLGNLLQGQLGQSFRTGQEVMPMILERFPATLELTAFALLFSAGVALPVGVVSAVRRDSWFDRLGKGVALIGLSVPVFWLGIVLIWLFAVTLQVLPASGREGPLHLVLPSVTLGWFAMAGIMRVTRSAMLDVLGSDFVRTARAKGLAEALVVWRHALRNALIPVVTYTSILFVGFLAGAIVTETVFSWPGLGRLVVESRGWCCS